jgi:hypothetical protein
MTLNTPTKKLIIKKRFSACYILKIPGTFTSFFKDKKSKRGHKTVGIKVFDDRRIQGFGSGSVLDPYSIGPLDPDPDP